VAPVHDKQPVETLADGADEALGHRVRLRCAHRRLDDLDALAREDGVEVARELAAQKAHPVRPSPTATVERRDRLGGLIHEYNIAG